MNSFRNAGTVGWLGVGLAALVSWGGGPSPLTAGEPIQFSSAKSKAEPGAPNSKLPKAKVSNLDRLPSSNPLDSANAVRPMGEDPRRPKTREEKMRRLKELEDKNWTAVEPGELQEEEAEKTSMGVRDYDVETGGKEKTSSDVWLERRNADSARSQGQGNLRSRGPSTRGPSTRGPGQSRPGSVREANDGDSDTKINIIGGQTSGQSAAASASSESRLSSPLVSDPLPGGLRDTFDGGRHLPAETARRGDLGLLGIEGSAGRREASARGALSAAPGLIDTPKSQPSGLFTPAGSGSGFGLSGSRYSSPAFSGSSLGSRGGSGFGNNTAPLTPPRNPLAPGSPRDSFAPPTRPSSGR